jgi:hypothetical protein
MCLSDKLLLAPFGVVGNVAYSQLERSAEKTGMFVHLRHPVTCG